jgi:hypothetical protein
MPVQPYNTHRQLLTVYHLVYLLRTMRCLLALHARCCLISLSAGLSCPICQAAASFTCHDSPVEGTYVMNNPAAEAQLCGNALAMWTCCTACCTCIGGCFVSQQVETLQTPVTGKVATSGLLQMHLVHSIHMQQCTHFHTKSRFPQCTRVLRRAG